jgi:hypothetical protein
MFKKIVLNICLLAFTRPLSAQVTNAHVLFQYSMNPFQPTALPYNYLDKRKNEKGGRAETKMPLKRYLNASNRSEIHPQTGVVNSSIVAMDYINHPGALNFKIGAGLVYQDLDAVQIASPYLHVSVGIGLDGGKRPNGEMEGHWRLLGGAGIRLSNQRLSPNSVLYKDINDPKIPIALQMLGSQFTTIGISTAVVNINNMYMGIGLNRIILGETFKTADKSNFTEVNFLMQYGFQLRRPEHWNMGNRGNIPRKEINPNRSFLSDMSLSLALRSVVESHWQYPLHAQFNGKVTLTSVLWCGVGWNTANRTQLQFGLLKIPFLQSDAEKKEYQLWLAYDVPSFQNPKHGAEVNIGYYW